ncbi:MAG: GNAT family N-acetyltransferase [Nocardioides sp.]
MSELLVRPADVADVGAVVMLEERLFGADAWSAESVGEELTGAGRLALVGVVGNDVVAYVVTMAAGDVVDLLRVGVDPDWRRNGIAATLLDIAVEDARLSDVPPEAMLLEVSAANAGALAFYAASGFTEIDRRRGYYRDGTDAVVMRRPLAAGGEA